MRVISFLLRLTMFWIPFVVALLAMGYAIFTGNVGMAILAFIVALALGLLKIFVPGGRAAK